MTFNLSFKLGDDDDAVRVSVDVIADNLEAATKIGREYPTRKLLAKGVSWDDGKAHLTGVNES